MRKTTSVKNKIFTYLAILLGLILAFIGGYFSRYIIDSRNANVVSDVVKLIDKVGYVYDQTTGEERKLTEKEIVGAITNSVLDDYAKYYTQEELVDLANQRAGNNTGIGLSFIDEDLIVDKVIGGSPAKSAGVISGDRLVSGKLENQAQVQFSSYDDLTNFMSNVMVNQTISLTIERGGQEKIFNITKKNYIASYVHYKDSQVEMTYDNVDDYLVLKSVETSASFLGDDKAIITLDAFNGDCVGQFRSMLERMKERGRTKLILDLRNNGGGDMDLLLGISSMLIKNEGKANTLVAVAKGKQGSNPEYFYTTKNDYYSHISAISVVANERTASASECLIGALIHYGDNFNMNRLVIEKNQDGVAKTFGKGIMQTTYYLATGGALKLTTAKIYWPDSQTCIHSTGIIATGENATTAKNALARAVEVVDLPLS